MPISPIARITSNTSNVVGAANRAAAVASLLAGNPPNVFNVGNAINMWPEQRRYTNDNNAAFSGAANPQFVWTTALPLAGVNQGFAVQSKVIPLTVGAINSFVISLSSFADNAHRPRIEAINAANSAVIPIGDLGLDLTDGSLNPLTTEVAPYNWQMIHYYTIPITFGLVAAPLSIRFIISFEAVNYISAAGPVNPAGLAFVSDIYQALI